MTDKAGVLFTTLTDKNGHGVTAQMSWHEADPLVMSFAFQCGEEVVQWAIARDLLRHPVAGIPSGADVVVFAHTGFAQEGVYLGLNTPFGANIFKFNNWHVVSAFLEQSYMHVPEGEEDLTTALEVELERILS